MTAPLIATIVAASLTIYTGIYHIVLYRQRQARSDLSFFLTCLAAGLYAIPCVGLYIAGSGASAGSWQMVRWFLLFVFGAVYGWFFADETGLTSNKAPMPAPELQTKYLQAASLLALIGLASDCLADFIQHPPLYILPFVYLATVFFMTKVHISEILDSNRLKVVLQESEEKYRNVVQSAPMGMHLYQLYPDGRLVFVGANPAADKILGVDNQQFIGMTIEQAFPPLQATEAPERYRRACSLGEAWQTEQINYRDNIIQGAYAVWAFQTAPGKMAAAFLDITERKRAEEAQRKERDLLNRVMETSPAGIVLLDPQGKIHFANQRAEQVLGITQSEIGQRAYNSPEWQIASYDGQPIDDDDLPFAQVKRSGEAVWAIRHAIQLPGGRRALLSINAAPALNERGEIDAIVTTVEDVTARIQAEEALRQSEERYRTISELTSDLAFAFHISPVGELSAEWIAGALQKITGYTLDEIKVPGTWMKLVHPDDLPRIIERVQQIGKSAPGTGELRVISRSGEVHWLRVFGKLVDPQSPGIHIIGAAQDITERKKAEQALKQYNERLEILHKIDNAILSAQSPQDIAAAALRDIQSLVPCYRASVTLFSDNYEQVHILALRYSGQTQISSEQTIPVQEFDWDEKLLHGEISVVDDLSPWIEKSPLRRKLAAEGVRSTVNVPLVARQQVIGALNLGSDQLNGFDANQIDIARELAELLAVAIQQARLNEQVQRHSVEMEDRVRQRTAELEEKNRDLETFTYSVSHDLKAPLRGIDGYSSLLLKDYASVLDEDGRMFIHSIRRATDQMHQLINDLLAYSRLERRAIVKGPVHLPTLLQDILTEYEGEIRESHVTLAINLPCETVSAEPEGLGQALRNLIDNALKFTRHIPSPRIEIGGRKTENSCILWVRDNGIGFDMQYHDRIFEIFQRLHRTEDYPGTGIGLALVFKVINRMGGRVWAESIPGAGATFYLELIE